MANYDGYIQDNNGNTILPITSATNVIETESEMNIKDYVDKTIKDTLENMQIEYSDLTKEEF